MKCGVLSAECWVLGRRTTLLGTQHSALSTLVCYTVASLFHGQIDW